MRGVWQVISTLLFIFFVFLIGRLVLDWVRDIMIRPSEGTMVYTGDDLYIETGPLADEAALRDALLGAGWRVIGQVDSGTGQSIARVERI